MAFKAISIKHYHRRSSADHDVHVVHALAHLLFI